MWIKRSLKKGGSEREFLERRMKTEKIWDRRRREGGKREKRERI
jgi:hypothetical protein